MTKGTGGTGTYSAEYALSPLSPSMKDPLLYRLYRAPLTGSLQIHEGKSLRTIATFTVGLEPVAFANKDWDRPGPAK